MGRIWLRFGELTNSSSEIVGYKSGLALSTQQLNEYYNQKFDTDQHIDEVICLRAEEYEELMAYILYQVGHFKDPDPLSPMLKLSIKWGYPNKNTQDERGMDILNYFFKNDYPDQIQKIDKGIQEPKIDPRPLMLYGTNKYGPDGLELALEVIHCYQESMERSLVTNLRRTEWKDTVELKELFTSQNLETQHGYFFDQRFIDYLARNHHEIGKINWRKFEALTCEFFKKNGFEVEIGPGRNDDGIDARVWSKGSDKSLPPAIIIQCKRQKDKVEKVQVKSLYAGILHTGADSGLIVTTSSLSPGARNTCIAREYPIEEIDNNKLKKWIHLMRTPGTGTSSIEE